VQTPLTHKEITVETRPPTEAIKIEEPVSSTQDITTPVKKEIGEVKKISCVKEEE
jgi:hypothetical protein